MNHDITVVIVTYNRLELLKVLLDTIFKQTQKVKNVIVVNNNSIDGTSEYLSALSRKDLIISNLKSNLGSAGGFAHGIKLAFGLECSFIWLLDDDGLPKIDALEKSYNILKDGTFHYAACNLITPNGQFLFEDQMNKNDSKLINIPGGPFNGILMSRKLIYDVGIPIERFFIWGEEMEYLNRIKEHGYITLTVKDSHLIHKSTEIDFRTNIRLPLYVRNLVYQYRLKKDSLDLKIIKLFALLYRIILINIKLISVGRFIIIPKIIMQMLRGFMTSGLIKEKEIATNYFK